MLRTTASGKRIFIWNSVGSAVYALSSFLLLIIVVRVCGDEEGGIFSIGYAIAQLMLTIGVFEATTFFATDSKNRFSYAQYLGFKIVTCSLMIAVSIVYVWSFGYDAHKTWIAYALCFFRLFEALSQFWFAAFQKEGRLDISGFSTTCRSVIAIVLFAGALMLWGDIAFAVVLASVSEALWIAVYDIPRLHKIVNVGRPDFTFRPLIQLLAACLPLFIGSFLAIYLGNVCKYAIDAAGNEQMQTVFNILFMPSFVINLFVNFFIRPSLIHLSDLWMKHELKAFLLVIARLLFAVVGVTAAVVVGCALVGIPVLQAFYGIDLEGSLGSLLILLVGGGFLSAANVFYNGMVIIRAQNGVLTGYIIAIVAASVVAVPFIASWQILGASVAYALSGAVLMISFIGIFAWYGYRQVSSWK